MTPQFWDLARPGQPTAPARRTFDNTRSPWEWFHSPSSAWISGRGKVPNLVLSLGRLSLPESFPQDNTMIKKEKQICLTILILTHRPKQRCYPHSVNPSYRNPANLRRRPKARQQPSGCEFFKKMREANPQGSLSQQLMQNPIAKLSHRRPPFPGNLTLNLV